ncbi:hypothetical protein [Holospora curviuscula]|nr:hypothetical protein [Holospora curviuscula]
MGYSLNGDVHSANRRDSRCTKRVLFGLKENFVRLVNILAHQGYQSDLNQ